MVGVLIGLENRDVGLRPRRKGSIPLLSSVDTWRIWTNGGIQRAVTPLPLGWKVRFLHASLVESIRLDEEQAC